MDPTVELVLRPAPGGVVGADPLAVMMIVMAAVWIFGAPWIRLCWWLGTRTRAGDRS